MRYAHLKLEQFISKPSIANTAKRRLEVPSSAQSKKLYNRWTMKLKRRSTRRRLTRAGLLLSNVVILAIILIFVLQRPQAGASQSAELASTSTNSSVNDPLDQLASANIALTVAQMDNLPEATAINNQADSQSAELAIASTDDNVVSKPQVVQTALKSRADITTYVTQTGDTIASIAQKFGVTSDSILWSNGLVSPQVPAGLKLVIPPVNGIVYTVKSGDTPASLAIKFGADQSQIVAYNDAEIGGLTPGEQIIIPSGTEQAGAAALGTAGSPLSSWGGPAYGSNGYDFGFCTWYVASQISVPSNWGNASTWAYYASLSGWNVATSPAVGSIAQTAAAAGGEGHVAIVEAVNGDQVLIKDMNDTGDGGGFGKVGSGWVSASSFQHYISN
jgi:surface antigen